MAIEQNKSNIKVAVDALAISRASAGSFTVLLGLMRELVELCDYEFIFYVVTKDIEGAIGRQGGRFEYDYTPRWARKFVYRCFWQQCVLPGLAKEAGCTLIYSASGYPEIFAALPVVSHQQNLWSFARPQPWWTFKNRVKSFLRRCLMKIVLQGSEANVFISDFLRDCANQMLPKTAKKNFTVHNAISPVNVSSEVSMKESWMVNDFCVAVGSVVIHKNYLILLRAFKILADQLPNLNLIIVGSYSTKHGKKVGQLRKKLQLIDRVVFAGAMPLEKIIKLYRRAKFSVNVSLLEGFGLPVLESMSAGCPVICSDSPAFREIGGEAVEHCDPTNPADIADKMITLCRDEGRRKQLSSLGLERAKNFSWQRSASKLLEVFELVLKM